LLLERQLAEEKRKTLRLEYKAKFRRHELAESRRLAPIPEHGSSLGLEQRGPAHTGIHQSYGWTVLNVLLNLLVFHIASSTDLIITS